MIRLRSLLLLGGAFLAAAPVRAQLSLDDFSGFESSNTWFFGDWSASGDLFAGDPVPAPTLGQGAGFYTVGGVSNADVAYAERFFAAPLDLSAYTQLSLVAQLGSGNSADALTVSLFDSASRGASATFLLSGFGNAAFTAQTVALTADVGFDLSSVVSFRLSGNDPFAGGVFQIALDQLSATSAISPVPEPSTYALAGAVLLFGAVALRRRISSS